MRVKVNQEDIDKGQKYSGWSGPLSYAFGRAFNSKSVFVGAVICLENGIDIELTSQALSWQTRYDRGEKVESIELSFSSERIYRRKI